MVDLSIRGGLRSWLGSVGASEEALQVVDAEPAPPSDAQLIVADPMSEVLLGDLQGVRRPTVEEMLNADPRQVWVWSGHSFHWIPGVEGRPGRRPERLVEMSADGRRVYVDVSRCQPQLLDHRRQSDFRRVTAVTGELIDDKPFKVVPIRATSRHPTGWRWAVREACRDADVVAIDAAHFRSGAEAGFVVVCAAAMGVPVVVTGWSDSLERVLAPPLVDALREVDAERLVDDAYYRDLVGVGLRREVLDHHSEQAAWRVLRGDDGAATLRVVVMVSSIRPHYLPQVIGYLNRQTYPHFAADVVVDRVDLPVDLQRSCSESARFPLSITRNDAPLTVGEIYNSIMLRSDADIAVIWDDDDHYAPDHLRDLVQALVHSTAVIAGKWAEYFHLAGSDVTVQRSPEGRYRSTQTIGGSNLAMWRGTTLALGGFAPVVTGYDQELIERIRSRGAVTYRTHGYGYVAARRASGHLWDVGDELFLEQSVRQWPGLELTAAGFGRPNDMTSRERYR